ncbi:ACP S-malonyltransferase [Streptomyces sp. NPDC021093]|uniref:ACP S-malonyltransferase n=1 Tax=Streptomyces sp. NPDC021093 TaxID=3365112 RepID=UPI0037A58C21
MDEQVQAGLTVDSRMDTPWQVGRSVDASGTACALHECATAHFVARVCIVTQLFASAGDHEQWEIMGLWPVRAKPLIPGVRLPVRGRPHRRITVITALAVRAERGAQAMNMAPLRSPAVLFPGQGSQGPGMGVAWRNDPAWAVVEEAEGALGRPLEPMLLSADSVPTSTTDTQLSVVLCSMMSWKALAPALAREGGVRPLLAGHSLGLISALHAAGVLTVGDTVRIVALRARLTEAACDGTGGMTALLLGFDGAAAACADISGCWVANDNAPTQTVISGKHTSLREAEAAATALGAGDVIPLDVAGPFHTPLMHRASEEFLSELGAIPFGRARAVIVHNGRVHRPGATGPTAWRGLVAADLTTPVRWRDTQHALARLGADAVVEAGYGRTLTGLAKRTLGRVRLYNASAPDVCGSLSELVRASDNNGAAPPLKTGASS